MSATAEPITDADVIPEPDDQPTIVRPRGVDAPEPAGTSLAVRERRSEVIRPLDTQALVENFRAYQELLPQLLTADDYQDAGRGKRFVTKSGWRKIAAAFDLDVQILRTVVDRDFTGQPERAESWVRAISPSGRAMDGDGYCDVSEERFSGRNGNKAKLENDLRTTATTRAMNRAISGLIGMGDPDDAAPTSAGGAEASDELRQVTQAALGYLHDGDVAAAESTLAKLLDYFDGAFPAAAGQTVTIVAKAIKDHREAQAAAE